MPSPAGRTLTPEAYDGKETPIVNDEAQSFHTILLVEDATDLARVIARELQGRACGESHSGRRSGVETARGPTADLVILDWMLPGLDRLECCAASAPVRHPVLMLTARDEEADRVLGLELGADAISKPFACRAAGARARPAGGSSIRQMMADDRREGRRCCAVGRYTSTDTRLATLAGVQLDVSRTEFDLLCLFLRHPGRAFSRDYILDVVWGEEYVRGDRSVDNAVLRLRKKLGTMGDAIETVWGVGYRWGDTP